MGFCSRWFVCDSQKWQHWSTLTGDRVANSLSSLSALRSRWELLYNIIKHFHFIMNIQSESLFQTIRIIGYGIVFRCDNSIQNLFQILLLPHYRFGIKFCLPLLKINNFRVLKSWDYMIFNFDGTYIKTPRDPNWIHSHSEARLTLQKDYSSLMYSICSDFFTNNRVIAVI